MKIALLYVSTCMHAAEFRSVENFARLFTIHLFATRYKHRRRIYLEDKAKVVTLDWGTESLPR